MAREPDFRNQRLSVEAPDPLGTMKTLILIATAVVAVGVLLFAARLGQRRAELRRPHDAVEYYKSWAGYGVPIHLVHRITKQQAEAQAARGYAYMIGYFDSNDRRVRDVKMLRGEIFFAHDYTYFPSGSVQRIKATNPDGVETVSDYKDGTWPGLFW
jgi:hypothetical protein